MHRLRAVYRRPRTPMPHLTHAAQDTKGADMQENDRTVLTIHVTDRHDRDGAGAWLPMPMPWGELHERIRSVTDATPAITGVDARSTPLLSAIGLRVRPDSDVDMLNALAILAGRAEPSTLEALGALAETHRERTGQRFTERAYASVLMTSRRTPIPYTRYRDQQQPSPQERLAASVIGTGLAPEIDAFARTAENLGFGDCLDLWPLGERISKEHQLLAASHGWIDANRPVPSPDVYTRDQILEHTGHPQPSPGATEFTGLPDWDLTPDLTDGFDTGPTHAR